MTRLRCQPVVPVVRTNTTTTGLVRQGVLGGLTKFDTIIEMAAAQVAGLWANPEVGVVDDAQTAARAISMIVVLGEDAPWQDW